MKTLQLCSGAANLSTTKMKWNEKVDPLGARMGEGKESKVDKDRGDSCTVGSSGGKRGLMSLFWVPTTRRSRQLSGLKVGPWLKDRSPSQDKITVGVVTSDSQASADSVVQGLEFSRLVAASRDPHISSVLLGEGRRGRSTTWTSAVSSFGRISLSGNLKGMEWWMRVKSPPPASVWAMLLLLISGGGGGAEMRMIRVLHLLPLQFRSDIFSNIWLKWDAWQVLANGGGAAVKGQKTLTL